MRLTTICENTAGISGVTGEWGLGILIEAGGEKILFDTGASNLITANAEACGVDLKTVDKVVISHGHYDHTGGLRAFLGVAEKNMPIYGHPDMWEEKYSGRPDNGKEIFHYIGVPFSRDELRRLGADFKMAKGPVWLNDSVVTTGEVPLKMPFEAVVSNLYVKKDGKMVPDPLWDDQAMVVKTEKGLVVVLGCAHHGMVNTLIRAKEITGIDKIHAVVGGTHLFRAGAEQIGHTIAETKAMGVERIGVSHCTGPRAAEVMAKEFGDRFFDNNAGTVVEF